MLSISLWLGDQTGDRERALLFANREQRERSLASQLDANFSPRRNYFVHLSGYGSYRSQILPCLKDFMVKSGISVYRSVYLTQLYHSLFTDTRFIALTLPLIGFESFSQTGNNASACPLTSQLGTKFSPRRNFSPSWRIQTLHICCVSRTSR